MPYFKGEEKTGPRDALYYFDQGGNLNAIRWNDWKVSFAVASEGNIATATREVTIVGDDHQPAHGSLRAWPEGRR